MKALQFAAPKHIRQIDLPEPTKPGPGEALVRVHRVGVCPLISCGRADS